MVLPLVFIGNLGVQPEKQMEERVLGVCQGDVNRRLSDNASHVQERDAGQSAVVKEDGVQ
jgi:hypothetical protein